MSGRLNPNMLETRHANLVRGLPVGPRLRELEKVIERGIKTFVEVGNALIEISDSKLYKEPGCSTFSQYCTERWGFKHSYASYLMESAKVVAEIEASTIVEVLPTNEGQARELARMPEGERVEVWAEVVEQHEPSEITAAVIREHVEARKAPSAPATPPTVVIDLTAITNAVRAAVRAGATTNELYAAYQAGFH